MPLYEYHCDHCQEDHEILVRGQERVQCPKCGSARLEKLLSVPAAHAAGTQLPMSGGPMPGGGCGRSQCGQGFCAGME